MTQGGEKDKTKLAATSLPLHPSLRRALEEGLSPVFDQLVDEQGWLESPERWTKVLEMLTDQDLRETLHNRVRGIETK